MSNPNEVTTVKYDTNGHLVWARRTPVFDLAAQLLVGVGLDGNETTYVATNRENAGIPDTTIFRYDKNGNPETPFSPGFGFINDFRVDAGGNSYLAGGSVPFPQFAPSDLLVAKLDPTGKSLWQDDVSSQFQPPPAGTVESALNAAIAPDSTGDTYYAQTALHSDGTTDTTLIKFDTKGVQQWLARSGGRVSSVLVNFIGDAYVSAHSITKYSAAGKALWTEPAGAATTIGGDGGLFVVGSSSSGTSADWVTIDYIQDAAKLTPAMLSFGNEALGKQSALQTVTLTNTGERNLIIKSIPVSGDFHLTNNCPTTLAAGASCKLGITFTPTELGARTGTLSVLDDWEGSEHNPQTVKLSGTGVTP
jgi:hypothetical protein